MLFYPLNLSNAISSFRQSLGSRWIFVVPLSFEPSRSIRSVGPATYYRKETPQRERREVIGKHPPRCEVIVPWAKLNSLLRHKKMDFCWKYAKFMGLQEPTEFFVVQKTLGNPPNVLDRLFSRRFFTHLERERRLPKLRYPTMRMPNSSKCQRWSSQWRGWSPAMFKKNHGMLCLFLENWRL